MPEVILSSITAAGLCVVALFLFFRHRNQQLEHQERMAALEKGAALPPRPLPQWSPRVYLLRGLIWTAVGAAISIALLGASLSDHRHYHERPEYLAQRAKDVSLNLQIPIEQARQIVEKDEAQRIAEDTGMPPAIALFGLIPLAVGLAYLVFYRTEASRSAMPAEAPSRV